MDAKTFATNFSKSRHMEVSELDLNQRIRASSRISHVQAALRGEMLTDDLKKDCQEALDAVNGLLEAVALKKAPDGTSQHLGPWKLKADCGKLIQLNLMSRGFDATVSTPSNHLLKQGVSATVLPYDQDVEVYVYLNAAS